MSIAAIAAGVLSTLIAVAVSRTAKVVHPRIAAVITMLAMTSLTLSSLWIVSGPAVAFLLHSSSSSTFLEWCRSLLPHADTPLPVGIVASAVLVVQLLRFGRRLGQLRREIRSAGRGPSLTVVRRDDYIAATTPGRHGRIIVSTGLLRSLEPPQQRAMLAHERAHLECRHDRFLGVGELSVALFPPAGLLMPLLRRSLERWADERAAREVGDRGALSEAIRIAALAPLVVAPLSSSMAATDVEARVAALDLDLGSHNTKRTAIAGLLLITTTALVTAAGLGGVGFQLHYLGELVVHVCPF